MLGGEEVMLIGKKWLFKLRMELDKQTYAFDDRQTHEAYLDSER